MNYMLNPSTIVQTLWVGVGRRTWNPGSEADSNRTDAFVMTHFLQPVF